MAIGCATHHAGQPRPAARGQALVEFALILPILGLVMVMAVDFGRVFFGWVGLQNAARIAANEAGFDPDAWIGSGDAAAQQRYRVAVMHDMQAINCAAPGGGAWSDAAIPTPTFADQGNTAAATEIGDHAVVDLECEFTFLTPMLGMIFGNPFSIGAHAEFPIRGGIIAGAPAMTFAPIPTPTPVPTPIPDPTPTPAPGPMCTAPELIGKTVNNGQSIWTTAGFTGAYTITRPPSNSYTIGTQSLVGGQEYPCTSSITVSRS